MFDLEAIEIVATILTFAVGLSIPVIVVTWARARQARTPRDAR